MKKTFLTVAIALSGYFTYAQTNTFPSSGNVGIGTTSPLSGGGNSSWLTLNGTATHSGGNIYSISGVAEGYSYVDNDGLLTQQASTGQKFVTNNTNTAMLITTSGNVGIGTTSPSVKLDVIGTANFATPSGGYTLSAGGSGGDYGSIGYNQQYGTTSLAYTYKVTDYASFLKFNTGGFDFMTAPSGSAGAAITYSDAMRITQAGDIGIGTTTPDAKLAVNGTIHTKEVKVDLTGWPDYVFKPKYNLLSLTDVKSYIDKNQHLPEMPSEAEVAKSGINLGEMNKLLVKKVEELTLYQIQQQKKSEQQDARIAVLEATIAKLTAKTN